MNKQAEQLMGNVFRSLDAIESACKTISAAWDNRSKGIPVTTYIQVIKNAKWNNNTNNKTALDYVNTYNKMLTLLTDAGIQSAKSFDSTYIPLKYVSESINELKKAFKEGAGNNV